MLKFELLMEGRRHGRRKLLSELLTYHSSKTGHQRFVQHDGRISLQHLQFFTTSCILEGRVEE
jgi:hypothetical protein